MGGIRTKAQALTAGDGRDLVGPGQLDIQTVGVEIHGDRLARRNHAQRMGKAHPGNCAAILADQMCQLPAPQVPG